MSIHLDELPLPLGHQMSDPVQCTVTTKKTSMEVKGTMHTALIPSVFGGGVHPNRF
jgi:hypothetical protein